MRLYPSLACCAAIAGVLLGSALPAAAAPVRGLYEASVPVRNQSVEARGPALQQALEAVLVRVVGTRMLPAPAYDLLPRASTLVQGYGYETAGPGRELRLHAQFDARAIEGALRTQGLPVWGANRPAHIAWIALRDDGQARAVLDAASVEARAPAVLATAEARGLPLTLPSMDATDRQRVSFNELWGGAVAGAESASNRYNARMVVIGRVGREGGQWLARWTLLLGGGASEDWVSMAATLDQALATGIHDLADRQAQRFAVQTGTARELWLRVSGVESLNDYGRALNYLRSLNPVRSAQVEAAEPGALLFRLRVEGDPDTLARVIAAGRVLRPRDGARVASSLDYDLVR
ncbi:MAG: DUF2066 domain-containing protein [Nevskiaceae bacterium]